MNTKFYEIAEEAGFCVWEDEDWNPGRTLIDWGINYDTELNRFAELLIKQACSLIKKNDEHGEWLSVKILRHYGVKV